MNDSLGYRIKKIRMNLGKNLEEFGKVINNSSKSLVSKWENDISIPGPEKLYLIAKLGGMSVEELLGNNIDMLKLEEYQQLFNEWVNLKNQIEQLKVDTNNFKIDYTDKFDEVYPEREDIPGYTYYDEFSTLVSSIVDISSEEEQLKAKLFDIQHSIIIEDGGAIPLLNKLYHLDTILSEDNEVKLEDRLLTNDDKKKALDVLKLIFL